MRLSEYGYYHKIKTAKYSSIKIAWRNVFRVPRRAVMVFCNLFLGITTFITVSAILGSTNVEMFTKQAAFDNDNSINLRNGAASWEYNMSSSKDVFSDEFINNLYKVPGLAKMRVRSFSEIKMNIKDNEGNIRELQGYLYGLDLEGISKICEEIGYDIDEEVFLRSEFVIVRDLHRNSLEDTKTATFSVGDKTVSYAIGALAPSEFNDYYGNSYNWLPCVYISEDVIKEIDDALAVYEIKLNIEKSSQAQALKIVRNLIANNETIILYSDIAVRLEAETIVSTLTIIGNCISAILFLIGILNFINVIITGILARQREFALLECVGESKKQIKRELTMEGASYAVITFILVSILGSVIIYQCFLWMSQQLEYMDFTFPITSLLIMIVTLFSICLFVPGLIYSYVNKSTIIDRLKNED